VSEAKTPEVGIVKITYDKGQGRTRVKYVKGTVEDLIGYFSYTLEIGHSYKKSINMNPKTIKAFVKALQDSFSEKEAAIYNRTMVDLVTEVPADAEASTINDLTKDRTGKVSPAMQASANESGEYTQEMVKAENEKYGRIWDFMAEKNRRKVIDEGFPKGKSTASWMVSANFEEIVDAGYGTAMINAMQKLKMDINPLESEQANEKWDSTKQLNPDNKGMFDGKTIGDLRKMRAQLTDKKKRTPDESTKLKQIDFAIRSKQKDRFGKIIENESKDEFVKKKY
jgi:hypothetical protein